jgi:hypothetical protein
MCDNVLTAYLVNATQFPSNVCCMIMVKQDPVKIECQASKFKQEIGRAAVLNPQN